MKGRYLWKIMTLIIIACLSIGLTFIRQVHAQPQGMIYLEVVNPKSSYNVGENFTVQVRVTNVEDCYGVVFSLVWNATLLNATGAPEQGDFLEETGIQTAFMYEGIDYAQGHLIGVAYTRLGDVPGVSLTEPESGLVASLTFVVLEAPVTYPITTYIEFADTEDLPTGWTNSPSAGLVEYDFSDMASLDVELIPEINLLVLIMLLLSCTVIMSVLHANRSVRKEKQ